MQPISFLFLLAVQICLNRAVDNAFIETYSQADIIATAPFFLIIIIYN